MRIKLKMMKMKIKMSHLKRRTMIKGEMPMIKTRKMIRKKINRMSGTPGFRRQTECEPCTCQDQQFTYTVVT
jgi:hypothetical protein